MSTTARDVFANWVASLKDKRAAARIALRVTRLESDLFGDCKPVGDVWELRIDEGPGYRVYYGQLRKTVILLLCGGDKRTQASDIKRAKEYWTQWRERTVK